MPVKYLTVRSHAFQDEKSVGDESDDQDPNRSEKANSATGLQGKIEKNGDQEADDDGAGDEQEPTHGEKASSSDDLQGKGEDQEADGDADSDNRGADDRGASDRTEEESDQAGKDDGADDDSSDSDEGGVGRRGVDGGERQVQGLNDGDVDSDDSDEAEPRERGGRQRERTADFGGGGDGDDDDDDDEGKAGQKKGDDDDDDDDDEGKAGQMKSDDDEDEDDDDDDDGDSRRRDSEGPPLVAPPPRRRRALARSLAVSPLSGIHACTAFLRAGISTCAPTGAVRALCALIRRPGGTGMRAHRARAAWARGSGPDSSHGPDLDGRARPSRRARGRRAGGPGGVDALVRSAMPDRRARPAGPVLGQDTQLDWDGVRGRSGTAPPGGVRTRAALNSGPCRTRLRVQAASAAVPAAHDGALQVAAASLGQCPPACVDARARVPARLRLASSPPEPESQRRPSPSPRSHLQSTPPPAPRRAGAANVSLLHKAPSGYRCATGGRREREGIRVKAVAGGDGGGGWEEVRGR
jgi:hypothetical protein